MDSQEFFDSYVPVICRVIYRIFGDSIPDSITRNLPEVVSNALQADRIYICRQRQPNNSSSSLYTEDHDRLRTKSSDHFTEESSDAVLSNPQRCSKGMVMTGEQNHSQQLLTPGTIRSSKPSLPNSQPRERHCCKSYGCSNQPVVEPDIVSLKTVHRMRCDEATVINHTCLVTASPVHLLPSSGPAPLEQDRDCCRFSRDRRIKCTDDKCCDQSVIGNNYPETKNFSCVSDNRKYLHLHGSAEHENCFDVLGNRKKLISSFNQLPLGTRIQRCSMLSDSSETGKHYGPREGPKTVAEQTEPVQRFVDQKVLSGSLSEPSAEVNHTSPLLPVVSDCSPVHNAAPSHPPGLVCATRFHMEESAQVRQTVHCDSVTKESEAGYRFKRPRVDDRVLKRKRPGGQSQGVKASLRPPLAMVETTLYNPCATATQDISGRREGSASYKDWVLHPEHAQRPDKVEIGEISKRRIPVAAPLYPNNNYVQHSSVGAIHVLNDVRESLNKRTIIGRQSTWGQTKGLPTKDDVQSLRIENTHKASPGTMTWDAVPVSQTSGVSTAKIGTPFKAKNELRHSVSYNQTRNSQVNGLARADKSAKPVIQSGFSHLPKHVKARKKLLMSYFSLRDAVKTFRKKATVKSYPVEDLSAPADPSNAVDETLYGPLDLSSTCTTTSTSLELSIEVVPEPGSEEQPIKCEPAVD